MIHGTPSGYDYHRCRCDVCTTAHRVRHARLKGRTPPRHGTASAYTNYGCRCDACEDAGSLLNRQLRNLRSQRGWSR